MVDIIAFNGTIRTMDQDQPLAEAIAIQGERILCLGKNEDIIRLKSGDTTLFDLDGKLVLPGFTDSHFHLYDWSLRRKWLDFSDAASFAEFMELLGSESDRMMEEASKRAGYWVTGGTSQDGKTAPFLSVTTSTGHAVKCLSCSGDPTFTLPLQTPGPSSLQAYASPLTTLMGA